MEPRQRLKELLSSSEHSYAFIRHCKTHKATEATPAGDKARLVNEVGTQQCDSVQKSVWWNGMELSPVVFVSEAGRTQATAKLLLGAEKAKASEFVVLHYMYGDMNDQSGTMNSEAIEAAFDLHENGYQPLQHYIDACGQEEIDNYVTNVLTELIPLLESTAERRGPPSSTTCIFSHAIYVSAVALAFAEVAGSNEEELAAIRSTNVGEVSGFVLGNGACRFVGNAPA